MEGTRRSRTAQGVLAERAVLTDMGVIDDPYASTMLTRPMALLRRVGSRWPGAIPSLPVTLAGLAARVRWHDEQVVAAMDAGIEQVAIVGAGYDSRAWRFRRDGVEFFEVDHPGTQQDKQLRAPSGGPTYVAADLRTELASDALRRGGFDIDAPAIYVLEGLTMYLSEATVTDQLTSLSRSAEGSRLSTDFYPPTQVGTSVDLRQSRVQRIARAGSSEDLGLLCDPPRAIEIVTSAGWDVTESTNMRDAARRLVPASSGLSIELVNEHKSVLSARV